MCGSIERIDVAEGNADYESMDGVMFDESMESLLRYPCGKAGVYTISESVTSIEWGALFDCNALTALTIPGSIGSFSLMVRLFVPL